MSLKELIKDNLLDTREFEFGQVLLVPDELVVIPDADRVGDRNLHRSRSVLIISNNEANTDPLTPVISVAPLSHRVDCIRLGDLEL
jgi:mRNA interferase MazF